MARNGSGATRVAIIGSGNIGTDLMIKVMRTSKTLEMGAMVGIDPASEGLARARRMGVSTTAGGVAGLLEMADVEEIGVVFDATSAKTHVENAERLRHLNVRLVDLTPAAIGPFVIPSVNIDEHLGARNVNMVTCGGQATIPIVAAVNSVSPVAYGEIVASISSKSAGPGTRANIDEFTVTTSQAIERVGGATKGKAIIVLNPAEPPMLMRDTVYCLVREGDTEMITAAIEAKVDEVRKYVPGYRLKQAVQFEHFDEKNPLVARELGWNGPGLKVTVFLEVEGAAHYLPAYAGNLDIMTSAALLTGERIAALDFASQS
jgi:acetaldehyde dehydrogenase